MCEECKDSEVYKFNLCKECYGAMFKGNNKPIEKPDEYKVVKVNIIQKQNTEPMYQLQYSLGENQSYNVYDNPISAGKRFKLLDEFCRTGKITITKLLHIGRKEDRETIEPHAIQFLPVEGTFCKSIRYMMIPYVLEPKKVWHKHEFERWSLRVNDIQNDSEFSYKEKYSKQIELAEQYGMKLMEKNEAQ